MSNIQSKISNSEIGKFFKNWLNLNRWSVFVFILVSAFSMIIYVNNVIEINTLLLDVQKLEKKKLDYINYNKLQNLQIIQLQSPDRIIPIASGKMGMVPVQSAPEYIK